MMIQLHRISIIGGMWSYCGIRNWSPYSKRLTPVRCCMSRLGRSWRATAGRLKTPLRANSKVYEANLERHFIRHLAPFETLGRDA